MKNFILLIVLYALVSYSLKAKLLEREIMGPAPIEVTTPLAPVLEEVKEYDYEGSENSSEKLSVAEEKKFNESLEKIANDSKKSQVEVKTKAPKQDADKKEQEEEQVSEKSVTFQPLPVENTSTIKKEELVQSYYPDSKGDMFFTISFGLANTRYDKLDSALASGSWKSEISLYKMLSSQNGVGISQSFLHPQDRDMVVENTTMSVTKPYFLRTQFITQNLYFVGKAGLAFADFNIRRIIYENANLITYKKIKSGFAFGLAPEVGLRYVIKRGYYVDLSLEYEFYFGRDNHYLGDFAFRPSISINF